MIIEQGSYSVSDYYTGANCPNCGRNRLLKVTIDSAKVKTICEKCSWCVEDSEYAEIQYEHGCASEFFG